VKIKFQHLNPGLKVGRCRSIVPCPTSRLVQLYSSLTEGETGGKRRHSVC
jgi:hypothetical protein